MRAGINVETPVASSRMRIGLDVTPVVTARSGLRRYSEELWQALEARADVAVSAFALGRGHTELSLPLRHVPIPLRVIHPLWRYVGRPRAEFFAGQVDVVHSLALRPAPTKAPAVQTIHDLLPITHPHLYPPGAERVHWEEVDAAGRADVVVTTCQTTADEITRVGGIPRERIVVAAPGAFLARTDPSPAQADEPYLLAVGLITPRKGLAVLAAATGQLGERCPRILVAGPDWWRADEVRAEIERLDTARRMTLIGPVDDERLAALYRGATIVCHTSLAEGFGMTCLEAMTAGAPLVASDLPSVREVVADAAHLIPVGDAEALADALRLLLADDGRRRELVEAGRARARDFSWGKMADDVVVAYRRALDG
jgi:glycosyltransferase involved in cell wall biosynthesis